VSRPLLTPNVCVLGTAALSHVPVGHAMGDDGKGYDLLGFFATVLANAVARHVHGQVDAQTQQVVFAAACIEMMRPLVPDLAQRAHELCFPDGDDTAAIVPSASIVGMGTDLGGQDFSAWLSPTGQYLQTTPPLQDLRDAGLHESITDDGEPQTLGHTLCFAYRGKSYSLNDHADYFGPGDLIHVLPAGTGDAVWAAVEGPLFGTYACCVQPIHMQEGARHV
jgi:hypothetical protein